MSQNSKSDVVVIGAGLAGLVAACEAAARGRSVLVLDQEGPQSLGGQAFWSLGGLFMVDTPEQRRMGIKDSAELALSDWMGSAQFDRVEMKIPAKWPRPIWILQVERCAAGCTPWACAGFRWSAGPNAAAAWRAVMATQCRGFT